MRRAVYSLLAASGAAAALLSGCIDQPKPPHASSAGGLAGLAGRTGGGGIAGASSGGASAGIEEAAGASGSAADAGEGGEGGAHAQVGAEAGTGAEAGAEAQAGAGIGGAGGTGGDTSPSQSGSGGGGGELDTFSEPCPDSTLDGWASVAGLAFDPALQPTPLEVSVSNAVDLAAYAASPDPYIIHVSGTINVPALDVKSNKTIIGDDANATLEGGIRIAGTSSAAADMVSNVVIRNLRINAESSTTSLAVDEADGIGIAYAHHVWIDHVDVWDAPGDDIDITHGSDYISVSWSQFHFVKSTRQTAVRVGDSDANSAEDSGHFKVTFHHNWWMDAVYQRMPRVRFGDVHVFNNYYSSKSSKTDGYCVGAAFQSRLLVENNYFDGARNPHVFFNGTAAYVEPTAQMVATGNTYVGMSDEPSGKLSGQGSAFTPPYSVALEPADTRLKGFARHCTGPR